MDRLHEIDFAVEAQFVIYVHADQVIFHVPPAFRMARNFRRAR